MLVDGSPLRERLAPDSDGSERFAERQRNWDRVLRTAGVPGCHVDLESPDPADLLQRLGQCRWPERATT